MLVNRSISSVTELMGLGDNTRVRFLVALSTYCGVWLRGIYSCATITPSVRIALILCLLHF